MGIFSNIKMALASIFDNKLRSFLTMISIIIGISSVIAIISIGRGASNSLVGGILDIIDGQISTQYYPLGQEDVDAMTSYVTITENDIYVQAQVDALEEMPLVKDVIVWNSEYAVVSYLDKSLKDQIIGTVYNEADLYLTNHIVRGRIFTESEFKQGIPNMLIHENSVEKLFGTGLDPIGREIIVNGKIFTIIGTYNTNTAPMGMAFASSMYFYIPYNAWISYKGAQEIQSVSIVPVDGADMKLAGEQIEKALNDNKVTAGTYKVVNFDSVINQIESTLGIMTAFISLIAAISLLVGGIGVMNIMYVSVVERTHEIGLRKALGANGGQVMSQFIIESITITTIGGLIGIVLGLLGNALGAILVDYRFTIYPDVIFLGVAFAVAVGLIFGTLPAVKAAKMQPIDALRSL
jgi:ABC-type transport system, involved in lipoprotein release, permease component